MNDEEQVRSIVETDNGLSPDDADLEQPPQDPGWRPDIPATTLRRVAPSALEDELQRARRRSDLGGF